jgi:hypothetical protein
MKKQKISPLLAAGVAAAVQFNPGQALASPPPVPQNTVTFTNETAYNSADIFIAISPAIANADELISISAGSAFGPEGGTFTLTVDYSDTTTQQLDSRFVNSLTAFNLNTLANKTFTEGTIDGLTFHTLPNQNQPLNVTIPVGTIFTFQVVPEPATFALAGMGAAGMWFAARRRAVKSAQQ